MDLSTLWSLRLGFSSKQAQQIEKQGVKNFLRESFAVKPDTALPGFLLNEPKTPQEVEEDRKLNKIVEKRKQRNKERLNISYDLKAWWIDKILNDPYPLGEKMTLFWHNHYVAASNKVSVNYWVYSHNKVLRENAFGNFRELTKKMVRTNALVYYLDNNQNRKGRYNENLSRELLELFTLGVGNYSEQDIKNGAKGLAGLVMDNDGATYSKQQSNEPFTYLGKTGNFKSDEMVDIIFEQKNAPYFITKKLLQWFIYDNPPENLVKYYGDYLREQDYEIQPLLLKIVSEEYEKPTAGSQIKNPLVFIAQLTDELNIKNQNHKLTAQFLKSQGMDLFNQPNVKGWEGGRSWLTAQLFMERSKVADQLCKGKNFASIIKMNKNIEVDYPENLNVKLKWNSKGNNKDVINQLKTRLLFATDDNLQADFEAILKYDFNPDSAGADNGVMRLFNYIVKTPEFQLI